MNIVILIGNLCKDGDLRFNETTGVYSYTNTVAVKRPFKNQNGEYDSDFLNIVSFGTNAQVLKKFTKKGTKIAIKGTIQTHSYVKEDGSNCYSTNIIVDQCTFLENQNNQQQPINQNAKFNDLKKFNISDEDLPF